MKTPPVSEQEFSVAKTLGDIQEMLEERNFLRVDKQCLVNLNHINKKVRDEVNYLIITNDANIPVARIRKNDWWKSLDGCRLKA